MRGRAALAALAAVAALVAGASACGPCAGIASCDGVPRLAVQGRIVASETGLPVAGTHIDMIRYWPDGTVRDSVSGTTDERGEFEVAMETPDTRGPVDVDVVVRPRAGGGYRVPAMRLVPSTRRGDAHVVQASWVDRPFFAYAGEAWPLNGTGRARLVGERIVFQRLSGVALEGSGWSGDMVELETDHAGRFLLLGRGITSRVVDTLIGRVGIVRGGAVAYAKPFVLVPTTVFHPDVPVLVFKLGLTFPYLGETRTDTARGDTSVAGVRVDVRRVSGAAGSPESFTTTSAAAGLFSLARFVPTEAGDVTFDLTFTPARPLAPFTKRITLPVLGEASFGERFARFYVAHPTLAPQPWK